MITPAAAVAAVEDVVVRLAQAEALLSRLADAAMSSLGDGRTALIVPEALIRELRNFAT